MEILQYVQKCIDVSDDQELLLTWHFLGSEKCDSTTKFYKKDSVYIVADENSVFNNQLFYCNEHFTGQIDWSKIRSLDEAKQTTLKNGLTAECFTFFEKTLDTTNVEDLVESLPDYTPFSKYDMYTAGNSTDIIIDDDQYYQIMKVLGQPFVRDRELEYNRQAILKLAVEPALRRYYRHFPIRQEVVIKQVAVGDYMIPYPTVPYPAYRAIAWKTSAGPMGGAASLNGLSPLAALGTDVSLYTRASGGNSFAQGIRYNKPVPGYSGEGTGGGTSAYAELATAWPIANTMKNIMRREKLSKVNVPGKGLFAKGYSTSSGYLNIVWLCWSRNFDDVDFDDWPEVIQLCQAEVKNSIGPIRELLRTDSNVPFKEGITKEGQDEIEKIDKKWSEQSFNNIYTPMRGGLVG